MLPTFGPPRRRRKLLFDDRFPEPTRLPPERFDEMLLCVSGFKSIVPMPVDPIKVAKLLCDAGVRAVMTGSFVSSSWAGRQAGRAPVGFIVEDFRVASAQLLKWMPGLSCQFERSTASMFREGRHLIQLYQPKARFLRRVIKNAHVVSGGEIYTTTPESELVLCWMRLRDPKRLVVDKYEDAAGIYGIVANCDNFDLSEVAALAQILVHQGGNEIVRLVIGAQAGKRLKF